MGKLLFKTSDDIYEFIMNKWQETDLASIGVILKVMSTKKSRQVLKLSKCSATTEYLISERDVLTLVIYEEVFDRLTDLNKNLLIEGAFSVVSYDTEHKRLNIDTRPYADLFNMRHKKDANGNEYLDQYDNTLEAAALAIQQIEDEEKARKEAIKAEKAEKKRGKKEE